jgi:hypothetical protein
MTGDSQYGRVWVDRTGSPEGFKELFVEALADPGVRGIMVLSCDENGFGPSDLDGILSASTVPLFGGLFPGIIDGTRLLERGTIVLGLPVTPAIRVLRNLSGVSTTRRSGFEAPAALQRAHTTFVFVDGTAGRIDALLEGILEAQGLESNYLGGGAGSLSMSRKPCLITNGGLLEDAAVVASLQLPSFLGVAHGFTVVSGPFEVTESEANRVYTLDWAPAFEVYREVVERLSGRSFAGEEFYALAKHYPFAIEKFGSESVVRDPVEAAPDGSLVCVGEVPRNSLLSIVSGDSESLIKAAGLAADHALKQCRDAGGSGVMLFFDCVSRSLCLEESYRRELERVGGDGGTRTVGALTLGEIANHGREYLDFHNKTAVVGILDC